MPCGSTAGYPEPYLKRDPRFSRRWQSFRMEQLVREEIRDLTQIQQIDQLQILVKLLATTGRPISSSTATLRKR